MESLTRAGIDHEAPLVLQVNGPLAAPVRVSNESWSTARGPLLGKGIGGVGQAR